MSHAAQLGPPGRPVWEPRVVIYTLHPLRLAKAGRDPPKSQPNTVRGDFERRVTARSEDKMFTQDFPTRVVDADGKISLTATNSRPYYQIAEHINDSQHVKSH